jgi:hypothetical protein
MRGLALATLFLGLCLIDPGPIENRAAMIIARFGLFAVAAIFIVVGA